MTPDREAPQISIPDAVTYGEQRLSSGYARQSRRKLLFGAAMTIGGIVLNRAGSNFNTSADTPVQASIDANAASASSPSLQMSDILSSLGSVAMVIEGGRHLYKILEKRTAAKLRIPMDDWPIDSEK